MSTTAPDLETVTLTNGLTCDIPSDSPLAKLLKSQRTWVGPSAKERLKILQGAKTVAIVGASPNVTRSSYFVATYLQQSSDYELFFVNPMVDSYHQIWFEFHEELIGVAGLQRQAEAAAGRAE